MKEQAIKKINKMGNVGVIITNILKVFLIIGIVGTVVGAIACAVLPNDLVSMKFSGDAIVSVNMKAVERISNAPIDEDELREKVESGNLSVDGRDYEMQSFYLDGDNLVIDTQAELPRIITLGNITYVCICGLVLVTATFVCMYFAGKLCKAFRDCESPFEENVIKKMRALAYSLIPLVALDSVCKGIITYAIGRADSIGLDINVATILLVLVVFALVYVFKYGALLQQEADETL